MAEIDDWSEFYIVERWGDVIIVTSDKGLAQQVAFTVEGAQMRIASAGFSVSVGRETTNG